MSITASDLSRLRSLATQQREIAQSNKMQQLLEDWRKHGRFDPGSRPMVTIELGTFEPDIVPPLLVCQDPQARKLEARLHRNMVNHLLFDDDTIVNPYMAFHYRAQFTPFGLPERVEHVPGNESSLGHHFVEQLADLEQDFHKLGRSTVQLISKEETHREMDEYDALLGDILPAKLEPTAVYCCPTQNLVHLMSMENMFFAMYDYPELFHRMMEMLTQDYLAYLEQLADDGRLGATTAQQRVAQGSYCFTDRLPQDKAHYGVGDVWGYMDSQETSGLSPAMYQEFIFPYYQRIMARMGRVSYGCCEAVDPIWQSCMSQVPNLGKVSISPWCNEPYMGEQLAGKSITYLRKPTPNLIGLTAVLDEDAVNQHFAATVAAARGCWLEIVQRDVYRIYNTPDKVHRYVALIRRQCEKHRR